MTAAERKGRQELATAWEAHARRLRTKADRLERLAAGLRSRAATKTAAVTNILREEIK